MDYALLLVIAVCGIALIIIYSKRKNLSEIVIDTPDADPEKPDPSNAPDTSGASGSNLIEKKEEKPSGPPHHTIYEFNTTRSMRVCPFCDGENYAGAKVCDICGQNM